jgi:hypothetical protein
MGGQWGGGAAHLGCFQEGANKVSGPFGLPVGLARPAGWVGLGWGSQLGHADGNQLGRGLELALGAADGLVAAPPFWWPSGAFGPVLGCSAGAMPGAPLAPGPEPEPDGRGPLDSWEPLAGPLGVVATRPAGRCPGR